MKSIWHLRAVTGTVWLRLRRFLFTPGGKAVLLSLVVVVVLIQLVAQFRVGITNGPGFTSDDVAQQTILAQWEQNKPGDTMVGNDNWALKYPLYITTNHLISDPYVRAAVTSGILVIAMVLCMIVALWGIGDALVPPGVRAGWQVVLPVASAIGLSPVVLYLSGRINARNIEIGVFLLLLWLLVRQERVPSERNLLVWGLATVLAGVLAFDDPMFAYFAIAPLIAVFGARWLLGVSRRGQFAALATAAGIGSLGIARILKWMFLHLLPVYYASRPVQLTSFQGFINHLNNFFGPSLLLFGADIWGRMITPTLSIRFLNLILLGISFYAVLRLLLTKVSRVGGASQYIGLIPFWVIGLVAISSFDADLRYFILLPFAFGAALVMAAGQGLLSRRVIVLVVCLFALTGLFNTAKAVRVLVGNPTNAANVEEKIVAKELAARHLNKGTATYWHANITSFYSNYRINVIGISCSNGANRVTYNPTLSASNTLRQPASQSFVLYYPPEVTGEEECSPTAIANTFGAPDEDVAIPGSRGGRLALYNHDVTIKLLGH